MKNKPRFYQTLIKGVPAQKPNSLNEKFSLNKERRIIFLLSLVFSLFGLLMIYEASSIYAWKSFNDGAYFFKRQFLYFIVSLAVFGMVLAVDLGTLKKIFFPILVFNIFLLALVLIVGEKIGGSRRWLKFLGFSFQPSEFLKISFLLWCADYFKRKGVLIRSLKEGILPLLLVSAALFSLIIFEPDLGTVMFWSMWLFLILFIVKARKRHLFSIFFIGIILISVLISVHPYRFARVAAYVNPWKFSKGSGFQLIQSQIAYGRGEILGVGLGESKQKLSFLPAAHTDFIFAIIAEEFGFIGSVVVLSAFLIFLFNVFKLHFYIPDLFRKNLCLGIGLIFALEIAVNIGVSCGVFPTKGLPLPFISYGGSSLLVQYTLLGLLFNASRNLSKPGFE